MMLPGDASLAFEVGIQSAMKALQKLLDAMGQGGFLDFVPV
jgi:hypothetical protein